MRFRTPAACARRAWRSIPDDILVEESGTHRALQETQDIPLAPTVRTDETISSETAVNLDQGDPLAEADFHMAYGLYDQAADLVRIAIQREPDRRDLKLKLLEVFFVWGNREQFLAIGARAVAIRATRRRRASGKRSSSWASRSRPKIRCSPMAAVVVAARSASTSISTLAVQGRVDFDPFDVSARMDVTGGGNPDAVDLDLGSALRDPDATGEGLALPTDSERRRPRAR